MIQKWLNVTRIYAGINYAWIVIKLKQGDTVTLKLKDVTPVCFKSKRSFQSARTRTSRHAYTHTHTHTHTHFWGIIIYQHWLLTLDKPTTVLDKMLNTRHNGISKTESVEFKIPDIMI